MIKEYLKDEESYFGRSHEFDVKNDEGTNIIIKDLIDTLNSLDCLYLTSNQIGDLKHRAFAIKAADGINVFLNPAFTKRNKAIIFREKNPIDNKEYFMPRYTEITIAYMDHKGDAHSCKFNEGASMIVGQAMDALNGIYPGDYGLEIIPEFDEASDEAKQEVLAAYVQSISKGYDDLDAQLSNDEDEEVKKVWKGAKFLQGVYSGDIETVEDDVSNREKKRRLKFLRSLGLTRRKK